MNSSPAPDTAGLIPRHELTGRQRDEMFALLARHFDGVTRGQFESDLAGKDWVVEIRDRDLIGFTTLRIAGSTFEGEPIIAIYSGDTIVSPDAWGTPALARAWIASVNQIRALLPARRCFWLLLTSGFRTYRFLPVFWREFHPCCTAPAPEPMRKLLHQLAAEGYGGCFDESTGIVRFPRPQRLRGSLAHIPPGREGNPHVAFFLARNPYHHLGDELACITEICEANLTPAGRRIVRQTAGGR